MGVKLIFDDSVVLVPPLWRFWQKSRTGLDTIRAVASGNDNQDVEAAGIDLHRLQVDIFQSLGKLFRHGSFLPVDFSGKEQAAGK